MSDATESPDPLPPAQCGDGTDNDVDGHADFPADPGCASVFDTTESPDPPPPSPVSFVARVVKVIDGDTIKVRTHVGRQLTVRLIGIDAPASGSTVECGGRRAAAFMKKQAITPSGRGRLVRLTLDPTQKRFDRLGQTQAYATLIGPNTDLARRMIRAGWATSLVGRVPFQRIDGYNAAQEAAKLAAVGAWSACAGGFHRPL